MRIALTYNEKRTDHADHAEFDTRDAIESVARIVAMLGHAVTPIDVSGSIPALVRRLQRLAPDLVLNFAEGERGAFREAFYPALYEQLGLAHTGSSASALAICLDKQLAKRVVAAAGVRVPGAGRKVPVVVKPNFEGSSKGVAIVVDRDSLARIVAEARARYPDGVLVEELVDGIDVAVGWVAGIGLLPPIRYRYDASAIYDYELKHVHPERVEVETPAILARGVATKLERAAHCVFDALGVTGYGRADFRVTPAGDVVFLELNPLPSLTLAPGHDELYAAAARLGKSPADLLAAIVGAASTSAAIGGSPGSS